MTEIAETVIREERSAGVLVRERYGLVLLLILTGYVLGGFTDSLLISLLNVVLWMGLLLTALWAPGIPDRLRRAGAIVTLVLLIGTVTLAVSDSADATAATLFVLATAQLLTLIAILSRVSHHERVGFQTVMGAVAAYALLAFMMAAVLHAFDLITDGDFLNGVVAEGDYVYFSFVTLTTVGYGDITAATDLAKRLVVVEAFVGQVFLIVLVARLVALWGQPLRRVRGP